jgi:hypothetical protein
LRRHDLPGWGKAWTIFIIVLPWLGALIYIIVNHSWMTGRRLKKKPGKPAQFRRLCSQRPRARAAPWARLGKPSSFSTAALSTRPSCNAIKPKALASLHAGSRAIGVPEGARRHYRCLHGPLRSRFVGALRASSARCWDVTVNRSSTEGEEVRGPGLERHVQAVRRELAAVTLKGSIVEPVGELPASAGEVRPR